MVEAVLVILGNPGYIKYIMEIISIYMDNREWNMVLNVA